MYMHTKFYRHNIIHNNETLVYRTGSLVELLGRKGKAEVLTRIASQPLSAPAAGLSPVLLRVLRAPWWLRASVQGGFCLASH